MNRERLQHLITILEKVQPGKLDMSGWFGVEHTCGTVACAVGHACLDPEFNKQGLTKFCGRPKYEECVGWRASRMFFGLGELEANFLFDEDFYIQNPTPADVIERIRELLTKDPT